ncbi:oligosaccharide flippase family protein [Fervidobacterium sp.]|uniref:lipopolysaccharide biosynthesis protein n=1 Tax=Fervidobacterium sp. TaxID=1871331 RepID=UPI0025C50587|nr:oligosaccharide flippase family protein [Fervidobacterium sp.]
MEPLSIKRKFLGKYLSFSVGTWINAVISFFSVPLVSWLIEPSEYGKANMFLMMYSMVLSIVVFGTPNALMRFYHKIEDKGRLLWSCLIVPIMLSTLFAILALIFKKQVNLFLVGQESTSTYLLLIASVFFGVLQTFNQTLIRIQGKGFVYSSLQIVNSVSNVAFVLTCAFFFRRDFYAILYAQMLSTLITTGIGFSFQHEDWIPVKIDKGILTEIIAYSYPFLLVGLLWWLLGWTDRIILRMYTGFAEIGLYSAAFKLMSITNLFTTGFSTFWYPFAYEQYEKNRENKYVLAKVFDYVSFVMFSLSLIIISAKSLLFLLFEKSYRESAFVIPFLLLNPILTMMAIVADRGIDFLKKTYWFIVSDGAALAFNLVGNLLLIPILGAKGAALSTGLSYVIVFTIESTVSEKLYPVKYKLKRAYFFTVVFSLVAAINTFIERVGIGILSSLVGLVVVILLYKDVFKEVLGDLLKIWTFVTRQ